MKKQMDGLPSLFQRWSVLLPVALTALACSLLSGPGSSTTSAPETPMGKATQTYVAGLDPLDRMLELRSIQFNLTSVQPDGTSPSVQGEIDSAGNMHLQFHSPLTLPEDVSTNLDPNSLPQDFEWYVVDGKTYQPDDQNAAWMTAPLDLDSKEELSSRLHGPDGPGLWLDILPDGSLKSAGRETVGGFTADKYSVNGTVGSQIITGNLWYETQVHALVQVELHIPAALAGDPAKPAASGELKITLSVQKADVQPVALPAPPAGTSASTPPAQATVNPGESGLPEDIPLYPGATGLTKFSEDMIQFQTTDTAEQVDEFYLQQMVAQSWQLVNTMKQGNNINQIWQKDNRIVTISIVPQGDTTTVVITMGNS